ncbi:MAG TPA: hypothetical protein VN519_06820 [Bryobacteraceae bacterium]|nr:hypothetical protein [Bryobacteraceae bacterium]
MADIGLDFQFLVDTPVSVFGLQKTAPYLRHDLAGLFGAFVGSDNIVATRPGVQMAGLRIVPEAGVLILESSQQKVPTTLAIVNFPSGSSSDWHEQFDNTSGVTALVMSNATWNNTFDVATNGSLDASSCFYARIGRGPATTPTSGSSVNGTNYFTTLSVGDQTPPSQAGDARPFSLFLLDGMPPFLQQGIPNPDGTDTWYWGPFGFNGIAGTSIRDCSKMFENNGRVVEIEWLPVPSSNTLVVTINNGQEVLIFRPDNSGVAVGTGLTYAYTQNLNVVSGPLRMTGQNGWAQFQYLPMQFSATGQLYSEEIDLPFVWQGNGGVYLPGAQIPDGAGFVGSIYPMDNTGIRVKYYIEVAGPDPVDGYVSISPVIPAIQMRIPPTYYVNATISAPVDLSSFIGEIEEHQWYDYRTGLVRSQLGVKFDNTNGNFSAFDGSHRACSFSRWLTYTGGGGLMQPYSAPVQFMTGWAGNEASIWKADPRREFDIVVSDNFFPEETKACGQLTYGDGWWINAWRRFLFNMRGRSDAFISDDFKLFDFGPNPPDCNGFKLPLGVATAPKVAPHPESKFLDALIELNDMDHSILFNDPWGVAQIMPYNPGVYVTPFRGYFNYSESGDINNIDFVTSMWRQRRIMISTADRRTGVGFFGPDPNAGRIQGTWLNADDIWPGFTGNVEGFANPLVKVSSWFIDPVFTAYYAWYALQKVTLPAVWEWCQGAYLPGLFALDRYAINDTGSDLNGTVFLSAEDITNRWSFKDPSVFGSTTRGRWLYNL